MTVKIRYLLPNEIPAVYSFLSSNGWAHRIGSLDKFKALISASQRCVIAMSESGDIVGFARALCDGISNGYLSMVVVSKQYQRQGIGKALVNLIIGDTSEITWVLRAGREGASEFFTSLGFEISTISMEKTRI